MKREIADRIVHHQKRKEGKSSKGDDVFTWTDESIALLEPVYNVLIESGRTFPGGGKILTPRDLWHKCIGDTLADRSEEDRLAEIYNRPVVKRDHLVLDLGIALGVIECLKKQGISI